MTSADSQKKPIMFFVDDELGMRNIVGMVLGSDYDVRTFANGRLALDGLEAMHAAGEAPAAMVTDGNMPVMDGGQLIIAARKLFPELPIVLGSGKSHEFKQQAVDTNTEVLDKPYGMPALFSAIERAKQRVAVKSPAAAEPDAPPPDAPVPDVPVLVTPGTSTTRSSGIPAPGGAYSAQTPPQGHHRPSEWTTEIK